MTFRQKCVKHLIILGVLLVILQVILSNNFDHIKMVYNNSTFPGIKHVFGSLDNQIPLKNGTKAANNTASNGSLRHIIHIQAAPQKTVQKAGHAGHEGHNGFELASKANNVCISHRISAPGSMKTVHAVPSKRLLYCPMEKIGTTFWRRVFFMLVANEPSRYKQPYDVSIGQALGQTRRFTHTITNSKSGTLLTQSSFSFLFVRNPFSRLLSAFIDKLVPPNPTFWKGFGVKAITQFRPGQAKAPHPVPDGHDVTFAEFLKFAVNAEKSGRGIDPHIISINKGCKPCTYHYKYIGKMEAFKDDALFIMKKLEMNSTVDAMEKSFTDLTVDDAITDSIRSPFSWKTSILKYISWEKALQRVWLKLQMRGIIESKIKLNIAKEDVNKINVNQFIEMARKAHRDSNPVELKKQKDLVKKEAFSTVPLSDIRAFVETFKPDFDLFGYDSTPPYIFNRGEEPQIPTLFFNYPHLN